MASYLEHSPLLPEGSVWLKENAQSLGGMCWNITNTSRSSSHPREAGGGGDMPSSLTTPPPRPPPWGAALKCAVPTLSSSRATLSPGRPAFLGFLPSLSYSPLSLCFRGL